MPGREQSGPPSDVTLLAQHGQSPSPVDDLNKAQDRVKVLARPEVMNCDLRTVTTLQQSLHYAGHSKSAVHHDNFGRIPIAPGATSILGPAQERCFGRLPPASCRAQVDMYQPCCSRRDHLGNGRVATHLCEPGGISLNAVKRLGLALCCQNRGAPDSVFQYRLRARQVVLVASRLILTHVSRNFSGAGVSRNQLCRSNPSSQRATLLKFDSNGNCGPDRPLQAAAGIVPLRGPRRRGK
jgi:hypothetical protein